MRFLIEFGSPENAHFRVLCCSHVVFAFFFFLIIDTTLVIFSLAFEIFVTWYSNFPDQFWVIFHSISLVSIISGGFSLFDFPSAILFYLCRILLILGVTLTRFIISIREFSAAEEPTFSEFSNIFQIIPVLVYSVGILITLNYFSYSTNRYRGYFDVDLDLRKEVRKKFAEFEADFSDKST